MDTDNFTAPALFEQNLKLRDQVFGFFFDFNIAIADNPEDTVPTGLKALKKFRLVMCDNTFEPNITQPARCTIRQSYEAG
ncbi:MAG: Uncharacterised protein [Hyphomonas sp. TMED17]|nr:MAG: Uncharacterised protein [Hyphomonas sp. TMED17]